MAISITFRSSRSGDVALGMPSIRWNFFAYDGIETVSGELSYWILSRKALVSWRGMAPFPVSPEYLFSLMPESERAFALACSIAGEAPDENIRLDDEPYEQ